MPGISSLAPPTSKGAEAREKLHAVVPDSAGEHLMTKKVPTRGAREWSEDDVFEATARTASKAFAQAERARTPVAWVRAMQAAEVATLRDEALRAAGEALLSLATAPHSAADEALAELAGQSILRFGSSEMLSQHLALLEERRMDLSLDGLRSSLAVRSSDLESAVALLLPRADQNLSQLGYLELERGRPQNAIGYLRRLARSGGGAPYDRLNLALAFWEVGSHKKALRAAKEVTRLAPGRKDVSLDAMRLRLSLGDSESVASEVQDLKRRGVDDPDLALLEVDIDDARGEPVRALRLLKRLLGSGRLGQEAQKEADLYRVALEARVGSMERPAAFAAMKIYCESEDVSPRAVDWLVEFADSRADGLVAQRFYDSVADAFVETYRLRLESHLAYLVQDWDRSFALSMRLLELDPLNEFASCNAGMLAGHLHEDWATGARVMDRMLRSGRIRSNFMINQAAYIFAAGGRGEDALALFDHASSLDYVMLATRGMAKISVGDFASGAKDYRAAFELIPGDARAQIVRALMATFQAQALHRFGVTDREERLAIVGNALPVSGLQGIEDLDSNFAMLRACADRNGWPWPTLF